MTPAGPPVARMRLDRRTLLAHAAAVAGAALLPGCATERGADGVLRLPMPRLSPDLVVRQSVGLRPFRPAGFRVEAERIDERLLVHHYGHGGCGVTLSWGTARLALEAAGPLRGRRVAVVGCGAVGLATARLLQEQGCAVTLYGRELPLDTTSNAAGALWAPALLADKEFRTPEFSALASRALRDAHARFAAMAGGRYGVREVPVYLLFRQPVLPVGWEWGLCPEFFPSRAWAPGQHPFGDRYAHEVPMLLVETHAYLEAVLADFRRAGGELRQRAFASRDELLALPEGVVFNCAGLGARELAGDATLVPVKGQLTVLRPQPRVDYGVIDGPGGLYMVPRRDGLLLGGTQQRGESSPEPDAAEASRILAGHQRLFAAG